MIKRLIFDLDNTLIPWQDRYVEGFKKAVSDSGLNFDPAKESEMYTSFEKKNKPYTYDNLINHFKEDYKIDITKEFIDRWIDNLGMQADINEEINKVIASLSKEYEVVVLTNFFKKCQEKRLATAGLLPYINKVIGGDEYIKPDPRSFQLAMENRMPEECIMIGDDYEKDIKGALALGMNVIYLTKDNNANYPFPAIKSIIELKEILEKRNENE